MAQRTEMVYPSQARNPRRVRAGHFEVKVAAGEQAGLTGETRIERHPIYIHATKVMSHTLAQELRSRAHTLVKTEEATAS